MWIPSEEGTGAGAPFATAGGYLGVGVSNNIAEYAGIKACMTRAVARLESPIIFQVDSLLIAMQLAPVLPWACCSADLRPLHEECLAMALLLDGAGVVWSVAHIYREYNQSADSLANRAVDERLALQPSPHW